MWIYRMMYRTIQCIHLHTIHTMDLRTLRTFHSSNHRSGDTVPASIHFVDT